MDQLESEGLGFLGSSFFRIVSRGTLATGSKTVCAARDLYFRHCCRAGASVRQSEILRQLNCMKTFGSVLMVRGHSLRLLPAFDRAQSR